MYCPNCTLPFEYCEFGPTPEKCKDWLKEHDTALFEKHYSAATAAAQQLASLTVGDGAASSQSAEGGTAPPGSDASKDAGDVAEVKKPKKGKKKKEAEKIVYITLENRNKRKFTTTVEGLGQYGIDLKKAAKTFAGRFSCGSAVTGDDEIVIQGDFVDDVTELIPTIFPEVSDDAIEFRDKKSS